MFAVGDHLRQPGGHGGSVADLQTALSRWLMTWGDLRVDPAGGVPVESRSPSYKGHRYPAEVISRCVWLYHRFPLSFREVEELMLERGVVVSYETVRRWCVKFGPAYARELRRGVGAAQRFLSAFSGISPHFRPRRHLIPASDIEPR
jgi:hypothetical protein